MSTKADRIAHRQDRADELLALVRDLLPAVLDKHPIAAAYVYGSVARGTLLPTSDLDLAPISEPMKRTPYDRLRLELQIQREIEDALHGTAGTTHEAATIVYGAVDKTEDHTGSDLPQVEIRIINTAPLTVRGCILQEGILVYEANHQVRVEFEVATRKRYFDFAPIEKRLRDSLLHRVQERGLLSG